MRRFLCWLGFHGPITEREFWRYESGITLRASYCSTCDKCLAAGVSQILANLIIERSVRESGDAGRGHLVKGR